MSLSLIGFSCWLIDRLACHHISQVWQLHAWWHILMACACHQAVICVVAVQLYQQEERGRGQKRAVSSYVHLYERAGLTFVSVEPSHAKKQ